MQKTPNILIFMVDQLNGTWFPDGPADFLHVPNLRRLHDEGVRFANAYCASPLCAPSRASFMSGLLPSHTGVYDNAAEFRSQIPTYAHHLRLLGYRTILSGKMHFVGPDQLHGFEERLTTDIYPADFGWTPDWTKPDERIDWWYHNLGAVTAAGTAETTNQLEYDDEVAYHAKLRLHQLARERPRTPFCMTVSFTHPHDPYVARKKYWDLYPDGSLPDPAVPAIPYDEQDPHSKRLFDMSDWKKFDLTDRMIADSRRAYAANISYLDDQIGQILEVLDACRMTEDTVIAFVSDHGDMLGARGLWFKMSFYEGSARVPMMLHAPGRFAARTVTEPVSTLDLLPTLVEIAGGAAPAGTDGQSLSNLAGGHAEPDRTVFAEYAAEGSIAPMGMVRKGDHKLVLCPVDRPQLFDVAADPDEMTDLAGTGDPAEAELTALANARWDFGRFHDDVMTSQRERLLTYAALRNGNYYPWDFQPLQKASERYMRNHMDLNVVDGDARYPRFGE